MTALRIVVVTLIMAASTGNAADKATLAPQAVELIDGDTAHLTGDGAKPSFCRPANSAFESLRIEGIDTAETHQPRCQAEATKGAAATVAGRALISGAARIEITRTGCDRYGRTLGGMTLIDATGSAVDYGRAMLATGHAIRYEPGPDAKRARERHWCGG